MTHLTGASSGLVLRLPLIMWKRLAAYAWRYASAFGVTVIIPMRALIFSICIGPLSFAPSALACSCVNIEAPERKLINRAIQTSAAIFSGEVIVIRDVKDESGKSTGEAEVTFKVANVWKGERTEELKIFTDNVCCVCGYKFEVGSKYLVYAYEYAGKLGTNECTRTGKIGFAQKDLKILNRGRKITK